jgi:hypothetical protein
MLIRVGKKPAKAPFPSVLTLNDSTGHHAKSVNFVQLWVHKLLTEVCIADARKSQSKELIAKKKGGIPHRANYLQ